jgi:hypothetical protein
LPPTPSNAFEEWREDITPLEEQYTKEMARAEILDDLVALPTGGPRMREVLARMRLLRVPVFAHERIRIFVLIQVAKSMVDFAVLALVRANCHASA